MPRLLSHKARPALSPFGTYLHEINETPLLNAQEERALAQRIARGDNEARDHMVRANLRLVVKLARGWDSKGLSLQDLIAEGNIGLLHAAEGFDPTRNTRFSTYASYWVKESMRRAQMNTAKTIRIPAYMVTLMSKWRQAAVKLQEVLGRAPTAEEIGASLQLPHKKLTIVKKAIRVSNLDVQSGQANSDSDWSHSETLMDGNTQAPDTALIDAENLQQVQNLLRKLDEREALVVRLRFGLSDEAPMTLQEIGARLGLTRERIRQLEQDALGRLREWLEAA